MLFGKYLKLCREKYHLTQEKLVEHCYSFHDDFNGLDIGTLSRWERGITSPSIDKQIKMVEIFQRYDNSVIPHFNTLSVSDVEKELCATEVQNLISNSKIMY